MTKNENSLMVIMAHPDDAEIWAGGTIAIHANLSSAYILVASNNKKRRNEAKKGAQKLGANLLLEHNLTTEICEKYILKFKPEIIITHNFDDFHIEHRNVFSIVNEAVIKTIIKSGFPKKLFTCDTYNSLTCKGRVQGKYIIDISATYHIKIEALQFHESQPLHHFIDMSTRLGKYWGSIIGTEWGEAFDSVPLLGRLPGIKHL